MRHVDEPPVARYRFGTRVLDLARRELRCDGLPQPLPARVFECLHHLIAHRDRAVGRDELVRVVFGRPDVSDAQLAQVVLRARRAIGDDGQGQRAIRTVPRFGFRWAMDVEELGVEATAAVTPAVIVEAPAIESNAAETPLPLEAANDDRAPSPVFVPPIAAPRPIPRPAARRRMHVAALFASLALLAIFAWPTTPDAAAPALDARETDIAALLRTPSVQRDPNVRAQLDALQGRVLMRMDRYAEAERAFQQAIALFEADGNPGELGRALMGRGAARMAQARFDDALADLGRARVHFVRVGDRLSIAKVDGNLGVLEMQRSHPQQAVLAFQQAERDFQALDASVELAGVRNMLVAMHLLLLQPQQALEVNERAWSVRDRVRDPALVADLLLGRAEVLMAVGRLAEAQALLRMPASRDVSPSDFHRHEYLVMELARQRGDLPETARLGMDALRDWPVDRNVRLRAWVALRVQQATLDARLPAPALDALPNHDALARLLDAAIRQRRANAFDIADARYREAVALAEASGVPGDIAEAAEARALWLLERGRTDEATALIGRLAPWAAHSFEVASLQAALHRHLRQPAQWRAALEQARRLAGERPMPEYAGL